MGSRCPEGIKINYLIVLKLPYMAVGIIISFVMIVGILECWFRVIINFNQPNYSYKLHIILHANQAFILSTAAYFSSRYLNTEMHANCLVLCLAYQDSWYRIKFSVFCHVSNPTEAFLSFCGRGWCWYVYVMLLYVRWGVNSIFCLSELHIYSCNIALH